MKCNGKGLDTGERHFGRIGDFDTQNGYELWDRLQERLP